MEGQVIGLDESVAVNDMRPAQLDIVQLLTAIFFMVLLLPAENYPQKQRFTQEDTPSYSVPTRGIENEPALQVLLSQIKQTRGVEIPIPVPRLRIVIFKKEHLLKLYASTMYLKSYIVSLGQTGLDDKQRQGDHLTPEGVFYIVTRNPLYGSKMFGFMGISYPSSEDALRMYAEDSSRMNSARKIIKAIRQRRTNGFTGFWYTELGGEIGIHGGSGIIVDEGKAHGHDWTWGCIGMRNSDIIELRDAVPSFEEAITPVAIFHSEADLEDSEIRSAFELFLIHPDPYIDRGSLNRVKIPDGLRDLFEAD